MIATDDGWDGERPWEQWPLPAAPLGLYMTVLSAMIRRGFVSITIALVAVSSVGILVQTPSWVSQGLNAYALSNPGEDWALITGGIISVASLPLTLAYAIFFAPVAISIQRIARLAVLAPDSIPTLWSALRQVGRRYGALLGFVVLLYIVLIVGCCLFVLPGIAAIILLLPAAYLVAAGVPLLDSFLASVRLVAANWLMVLIYVVVVVIVAVLWVGFAVGVSMGLLAAVGPYGQLAGTMIVALGGIVFSVPVFFFQVALLVTMEAGSYGIDVVIDPELADLEA